MILLGVRQDSNLRNTSATNLRHSPLGHVHHVKKIGCHVGLEPTSSWLTTRHFTIKLKTPYLNSSTYHYEQIPLPVTVNYLSISLSFLQYYYYMTIVCLLLIKSVLLCRLPCIVQSGDYNPPMRGLYGTRTHRSVWSSYALTDQRFPIHIDSPYINLGNINRLFWRLGLLRSHSQVMLQESLSTRIRRESNPHREFGLITFYLKHVRSFKPCCKIPCLGRGTRTPTSYVPNVEA